MKIYRLRLKSLCKVSIRKSRICICTYEYLPPCIICDSKNKSMYYWGCVFGIFSSIGHLLTRKECVHERGQKQTVVFCSFILTSSVFRNCYLVELVLICPPFCRYYWNSWRYFFKVLKCWFFLVLLQRSAVILVSTTSHAWSLASSFLLFELSSFYFGFEWCLFACLCVLIWFWRLTTTKGQEITWDGGFWTEGYKYSNLCLGVKIQVICKIAHKSL